MENEKNTTENNQNDNETKTKSEGGKTAVIVAAALMIGIVSGSGIYKIKSDDVKTAEADNQVTTIAVISGHVSETEEVTEEETSETTEPDVTTGVDGTTEEVTEAVTTVVSDSETPVSRQEISPLRNSKAVYYQDVLEVVPMIEAFNRMFIPPYSLSYYEDGAADVPEYRNIVVGTDDTYSFGAIYDAFSRAYNHEVSKSEFHEIKYYKVTDQFEYQTEEEVRAVLQEYVTDSFIERHYISNYNEAPGRYTLFKVIDGELYHCMSADIVMMVGAYGTVYNYDGKKCDVRTENYSPAIEPDPLRVRLVFDDGRWKIDGYEHANNNEDKSDDEPESNLSPPPEGWDHDVCRKAVDDLAELEKVVLGYDIQVDEDDSHVVKIGDLSPVYKKVTDKRFSNITEVENYICQYTAADLRMRCIDYIRGEGKNSIPVYMMFGDELYCNERCKNFYSLKDYIIISSDENYIQAGIAGSSWSHNCLFLKNTEDGWKMYDMD